jgi:carboxymethylenebutenolidase
MHSGKDRTTRMTAKDFAPELLELYDTYAHGKITKPAFLERAANCTVGGMMATTLLSVMSPDCALARQVPETDAGIAAQRVTYPSPDGYGSVNGYLVRPADATGKLGAVVVVHENRGLNP